MDLSTRVKNRGSLDDTDFSIYFTCSFKSARTRRIKVVCQQKIRHNNFQYKNNEV